MIDAPTVNVSPKASGMPNGNPTPVHTPTPEPTPSNVPTTPVRPSNENVRGHIAALYNFVNPKYHLGTIDQFTTKLQDPGKQKALYDFLSKKYNLGTFDEFRNKVELPPTYKNPMQVFNNMNEMLHNNVQRPIKTAAPVSISQITDNNIHDQLQATKGLIGRFIDAAKEDRKELLEHPVKTILQAETNPAGLLPRSGVTDALTHLKNQVNLGASDVIEGLSKSLNAAGQLMMGVPSSAVSNEPLNKLYDHVNNAITSNDESDLDKKYNFDVHKNTFFNNVVGATGIFARMLAPLAADGASGGTSFFFSGYNTGSDDIGNTDASPVLKTIYPFIYGGVNQLFKQLPISKAIDGVLGKKIVSNLTLNALKDASDKYATDKMSTGMLAMIMNDVAPKIMDYAKVQGINAAKNIANGALFGAAMTGSDIGLKEGVNALNGKKVFQMDNIGSQFVNSMVNLSVMTFITGLLHTAPREEMRNYIRDKVVNAKSEDDIKNLNDDIDNTANKQGWTKEQTDGVKNIVNGYVDLLKKMPSHIPTSDKAGVVDALQKYEDINEASKKADVESATVSPAFSEDMNAKKNAIDAAKEVAVDRLNEKVSGKKYLYYHVNGANGETAYYKRREGRDETSFSISKEHYDLATANQHASELEPEREVIQPVEQQEDNAQQQVIEPSDQQTETTTQPIPENTKTEVPETKPDQEDTFLKNEGEPVKYKGEKGFLKKDGQTYVVETSKKIYEIGNVNELNNKVLSDLGIEKEKSDVIANEDGSFNVRGKKYLNRYSNPLSAINTDKDGNIQSVTLEDESGNKRTFRNNSSEDIAYQITLKHISQNNLDHELEDYINTEPARTEIENERPKETTEENTTENNVEIPSNEKERIKQGGQNATQESQKQEPEIGKQGGVGQHQGVNPSRQEETQPAPDNSNSGDSSKKEEINKRKSELTNQISGLKKLISVDKETGWIGLKKQYITQLANDSFGGDMNKAEADFNKPDIQQNYKIDLDNKRKLIKDAQKKLRDLEQPTTAQTGEIQEGNPNNKVEEPSVHLPKGKYIEGDLFGTPEKEVPLEQTKVAYGNEKAFTEAIQKAADKTGHLNFKKFLEISRGHGRSLLEAIRKRSVLRSLIQSGRSDISGVTITSPADVADLFLIHRSPTLEKLHFVFTKGDKVIYNSAYTSGSITHIDSPMPIELLNEAKSRGADGFYILHNHPSGDATPSDADLQMTKEYSDRAKYLELTMNGHLVVDTNHFSVIHPDGSVEKLEYKEQPKPLFSTRVTLGSGKEALNNAKTLADALLKETGGKSVVLYLDSKLGISGYDLVNNDAAKDDLNIPRNTGSRQLIFITSDKTFFNRATKGLSNNKVMDVIHLDKDGVVHSANDEGLLKTKTIVNKEIPNFPTRLWEQIAQYGNLHDKNRTTPLSDIEKEAGFDEKSVNVEHDEGGRQIISVDANTEFGKQKLYKIFDPEHPENIDWHASMEDVQKAFDALPKKGTEPFDLDKFREEGKPKPKGKKKRTILEPPGEGEEVPHTHYDKTLDDPPGWLSRSLAEAIFQVRRFVKPASVGGYMFRTLHELSGGTRQDYINKGEKVYHDLVNGFKELKKNGATPKQLFDANKNIQRYLDTPPDDYLSPVGVTAKDMYFSKVPESMKPIAKQMRGMIDNNIRDMINRGYLPKFGDIIRDDQGRAIPDDMGRPQRRPSAEEVFSGRLGYYLTRAFRLYNEKGYGAKDMNSQTLTNVREFYRDKLWGTATEQVLEETDPNDSGIQQRIAMRADVLADQEIRGLLNRGETMHEKPDLPMGTKLKKAWEAMLHEEDIPEPIREAMGEIHDVGYNFINTIRKQANFIGSSQFLTSLRERGMSADVPLFYRRDQVRPHGFDYEIPGEKGLEPLAGLYTNRDTWQALKDIDNGIMTMASIRKIWLGRAIMNFYGVSKAAMTVGNIPSHGINTYSRTKFSVMNGDMSKDGVSGAFKFLKDAINRNGNDATKHLVSDATRWGVINHGVGVSELNSILGTDNVMDGIYQHLYGKKKNILKKTGKVITKGVQVAEKVYGTEDDFFNVLSFVHNRNVLSKAYHGKDFDELTDKEKEDINEEASERTKNTNPTYGRVYPFVKIINKIPLFGDFLSYKAENYRVSYNIAEQAIKDLKNDNPVLRAKGRKSLAMALGNAAMSIGVDKMLAVGTGGIITSAYHALFDSDDGKQQMKDLNRYSVPYLAYDDKAFYPVPGQDATYKYYNLSRYDALSDLQGTINGMVNPGQTIGQRAVSGLNAMFGDAIKWSIPVQIALNLDEAKTENGQPIYNEFDDNWTKLGKITYFILKNSLLPGTVNTIIGAAHQKNEPFGKNLAERLEGRTPYFLNVGKEFKYKVYDNEQKLQTLSYAMKKDAGNEKVTEYHQKQYQGIINDMTEDYNSALRLGVSPDNLLNSLKKLRIKNRTQVIYDIIGGN